MSEKPIVVEARCRVCGRKLTDPESVKIEIGPVCKETIRLAQLMEKFTEESTCPECGTVNPYPDAKHCPSCGSPMKARTVEVVLA